MIPYEIFDLEAVDAIPLAKYDVLSLPFAHYRPVRAIRLSDRFVLIYDGGIWDTSNGMLVAKPNGPRFYPGARLAHKDIDNFIKPYKLRVVDGIWVVENTKTGHRNVYRDDCSVLGMFEFSIAVADKILENTIPIKEYINDIDIEAALRDHSLDACTECHGFQPNHLDFHLCRRELGANLASELTGMVANGSYTHNPSDVRERLFEVLKIIKLSHVLGFKATIQVSRKAERFFYEECNWNTPQYR